MQDEDRLATLPGSRGIALVLPMLLSIANSIAVWFMVRFFGLYVLVFVGLCVKNSVVLAVADGPMLWPAVVVELVLAAVLLRRLAPPLPVSRPAGP